MDIDKDIVTQQLKEFSVSDAERGLILDAVALMGGNEYLVQQMVDKFLDTSFSEEDMEVLSWVCNKIWKEDLPEDITTEKLLSLLYPLHRERLPRLLASSLLYCGRDDETLIVTCPNRPSAKILLISMTSLPGSDPPIGVTPGGNKCNKLAILYHWASNTQAPRPVLPGRVGGRKISASLALEKQLLTVVDVFAFMPCP